MNPTKSIKFTILIVSTLLAFSATAYDFEVDGVCYDINQGNESVIVSQISSLNGDVIIPKTVINKGKTYLVTSIGDLAFFGCIGLMDVTIPNSVTSIGDHAFSGCSGLTDVTIPNSVTSIGECAFYGCSGLTDVTIPNSTISIGNNAFEGCSGLTDLIIPNSITSIGLGAFDGCSGLTSIVVEKGNSNYDSRDDCNAIIETSSNTLVVGCKNTIFPNSVTSIDDYAFKGCSGLTDLTIPNSITSIGLGAFDGCSGLTSIVVIKGNSNYDSRDDCNAIIETKIDRLSFGCKNTIIPNSVTSIDERAFFGCSDLGCVAIPNSITAIYDNAYACCTGLTSVAIPNSVMNIYENAFNDCDDLTSVTIGNSVTYIGNYSFSCKNLEKIYCNCAVPAEVRDNAFASVDYNTCILYVPKGSQKAYKDASVWCNFVNIKEWEPDKK
ncbi:MAG: leucine-rich repeat domain-containing protein [Muribaculaceae bacterium]|nr:leucine-rich repeat domain-containing protein [Muribaculaceae bacterium]